LHTFITKKDIINRFYGGLRMKKSWILIVLLMFLLVGTAGATEIKFDKAGDVYITYLGGITHQYDNSFGWVEGIPPGGTLHLLGKESTSVVGTVFLVGPRAVNEPVYLYITNPLGYTFYNDPTSANPDSFNHVTVIPVGPDTYRVECWFEDVLGGGDQDVNDVILEVKLVQPVLTPEFPTMALPAALIVGMLGAVLFVKRTKEN